MPPHLAHSTRNQAAFKISHRLVLLATLALIFGRLAASGAAGLGPPTITQITPRPGALAALDYVTVTFSEAVTGLQADDLLINGVPSHGLSGAGNTYSFDFAQPLYGTVFITWANGHGIVSLAQPPRAFDATAANATWRYELVDRYPPEVAQWHPPRGGTVGSLRQIEVTFDEPILGIRASDLIINGRAATNLIAGADGSWLFQFPAPAPGFVSVAWASNHGITDASVTPNRFVGGSWSYTIDPNRPQPNLVITEILAANVRGDGLTDENGEPQDWIEIQNRDPHPAQMENWSLSDDPDRPGLWTFPARTLEAGQFLVVFTSGLDRRSTDPDQPLHTNFKLSVAGEPLGLYSSDSPRQRVSGFDRYPEQRNDISYGLDPAGVERYFTMPTPGSTNLTRATLGSCEPVHVNAQRGHFATPFDLTVSCPTTGAVVRYTTDGSEPIASSPTFPASLRIARTTLFRAAAFQDNFLPSPVVTHTYFFNLPANIRSLPVISIVTASHHLYGRSGILGINGGNYRSGPWSPNPGAADDYHNPSKHGLAWERPTSVEWIRPEDHSGFQVDCGLRVQGSDYQRPRLTASSKFSFRLYFRSDYGPGRLEYPLFPLTSVQRFDQIVLRAGFNEPGNPFIRDELHRRLAHDMGQVASHGTLAVVFVNGVYNSASPWYNPCERVHEEFLQEHLGGGDEWDVVGPSFAESAGARGVIDGDRADFQSLVNTLQTQSTTNPTVYRSISRRLDLTNFVDYCLLNAYAAMGDWPANNWRAGRDRRPGSPWRFIVWDAEWGMGIYDRAVTLNPFTQSGGGPNDCGLGSVASSEIARMYDRLRASPEFRLLWADRVHKHFAPGGALTGAHITNRFEELRRELRALLPSMDTKILRWARDRQSIFFDQMAPYDLLASSNAPGFSPFGGVVPEQSRLRMTNLSGAIYYTLDGSDPREPFTGAVTPTASLYTEPGLLPVTVTVRARSRQGTNWSALTEATFAVATLGIPLRFTEIHYHPWGGSAFEFVELQNISSATIDLGGMTLEGVKLRFAEGMKLAGGARLVIGSNTDTNAWRKRYPAVASAGWFSGSLDNAGERLTLLDPDGHPITSVTYQPDHGWPAGADGSGYSLEVIDPRANPDDPANWRASVQAHGTPGVGPGPFPKSAVQLNEVMADNGTAASVEGAHPDWIELFNSGSSPVDLSGWSLSASRGNSRFIAPPGTSLPARGYLIVWCDGQPSTGATLHAAFALDRDGESLFLDDAAGNRIDAITWGRQVTDFSVGRINGEWGLTRPTPNAANQPAALAPPRLLTLNEWQSNPRPGDEAWVELFNRSAAEPVALRGMSLGDGVTTPRHEYLSFLAPHGYARWMAHPQIGPDRLGFSLSASGGILVLYDSSGSELERVSYGPSAEGASQGRWPDGQTEIVIFTDTASPGAMNYTDTDAGPILNEVLARGRSPSATERSTGFVEIFHRGPGALHLGGMSLGLERSRPGQWVFPSDTLLAPGTYLVVACDSSRPVSARPGDFNLGRSLDGESGGVYLFNTRSQLVSWIEYGFQIENRSIGLSGGQWRLLGTPTPGATNSAPAALDPAANLRLNEWMADSVDGTDWFELYNPSSQPIDLNSVTLTDDPSIIAPDRFRPAPLSFIAAGGFVTWMADGQPAAGRQHVNFKLDASGDSLLLNRVNGTNFIRIGGAAFGPQRPGVSTGSFPDGTEQWIEFPGSATPGRANVLLGIDTDRDGIPDPAELQLGLNPVNAADGAWDADGDGISNAAEYLSGTDLRDPNSRMKLESITVAGGTVMTFRVATNRTYSVLYSDSLTPPAWRRLADVTAQAESKMFSITDNAVRVAVRFYRLVTPAAAP